MSPKRIIIKKPKSKPRDAGDTYADVPLDPPQLRTRRLSVPAPKIIQSDVEKAETAKNRIFKFYCIRCGQKLSAQVGWVGKEVNCTTCDSKIVIPKPPK